MNKFKQIELENIIELRKEKYNPLESDINKPCIELEHFDQETGQINGFISSLEQKSIKNVFYKGDVLFGKLRPYLKKYWLAEFDGVCSSEAWVLKPKNNNIITKNFLFYLVQSELFIRIANISSGSKMPRADWNYISEYPFPIPPLKEQERITKILLTCDKAIRLTTQIITQLKQRNQGLAQQLLTGEKRVKGFEKSVWKEVKLGEIGEVYQPETISQNLLTEEGFKVYGANGVIGYYSRYNHEKEQIAVVCRGSTCGLVNFTEAKSWITGNAMVINLDGNPNYSKLFVYEYLKNDNLNYLITGSGQPQITSEIKNHIIKVPSFKEQNAIAQILDTVHQELKLYEQKLQLLQTQKKTLMQKLLTGEVLTIK